MEGPIDSFTANGPGSDRILTIMGIPVIVTGQTNLYSPSATRQDSGVNLGQWYNGDKFPGRRARGFIGGTGTALGTFDPDYIIVGDGRQGAVIADEVFSEPAENVILGLVSDSQCSNADCNNALFNPDGSVEVYLDWTLGNANTYMVPLFDSRMPAGPITDELGFELDLTGSSLTGREFGVEGYYGDTTTPVDTNRNGVYDAGVDDVIAHHYFLMELSGVDGSLLATRQPEVSVLRIDCRDEDELEIRGGVHSRVNQAGNPNDGGAIQAGRIIEVYVDGIPTPFAQGAAGDITGFNGVAGEAFGQYRLRDRTVPFCPTEVDVVWRDLISGAEIARLNDVAVEVAPVDPDD